MGYSPFANYFFSNGSYRNGVCKALWAIIPKVEFIRLNVISYSKHRTPHFFFGLQKTTPIFSPNHRSKKPDLCYISHTGFLISTS